ncbi:MAG: DUF4383 domain-containing protein [Thermoleophilaceae bacterium]
MTGSQRSPAQTFSFLIGAVLTVAGIVGFFYNGDFSAGSHIPSDDVFGLLSVNGWHNVVHLLTGLVGLKAARTWTGARAYSYAVFVLYTAIFVLGLAYGTHDAVLSLIPINAADDALHGIIAAAALVSGLATPDVRPPTLAPSASP